MTSKVIKTNGVGHRTTSHLNLTRSLADVWGVEVKTTWPAGPRGLTPAQQAVAEGYLAGQSCKAIAAKAGISPASVPVIACRMGIKRPPKSPKPVVVSRPPYAGYDRYERPWA